MSLKCSLTKTYSFNTNNFLSVSHKSFRSFKDSHTHFWTFSWFQFELKELNRRQEEEAEKRRQESIQAAQVAAAQSSPATGHGTGERGETASIKSGSEYQPPSKFFIPLHVRTYQPKDFFGWKSTRMLEALKKVVEFWVCKDAVDLTNNVCIFLSFSLFILSPSCSFLSLCLFSLYPN